MSEVDLGRYRAIQMLGIVELVTFITIAYQATAAEGPLIQEVSQFPLLGQLQGLSNLFWLAALSLVPSSVIFIISPFVRQASLLRVARGLQLTLFIFVCIALIPAMMFATVEPQFKENRGLVAPYFVTACLLGILFFVIMSSIIKPLVAIYVPVPPNAPATAENKVAPSLEAKFCPTCGSALTGTDGKCPNCA